MSPSNRMDCSSGVASAGLGPNLYEQTKGAVGQFHTNLAAAGIDRNAVDIISHFHGDHVNGLYSRTKPVGCQRKSADGFRTHGTCTKKISAGRDNFPAEVSNQRSRS